MARRAIALYDRHGADRIIGETNNGGDLIETTLRTVRPAVPYKAVTATKGKRIRAEPVAALYEQNRVNTQPAWAFWRTRCATGNRAAETGRPTGWTRWCGP